MKNTYIVILFVDYKNCSLYGSITSNNSGHRSMIPIVHISNTHSYSHQKIKSRNRKKGAVLSLMEIKRNQGRPVSWHGPGIPLFNYFHSEISKVISNLMQVWKWKMVPFKRWLKKIEIICHKQNVVLDVFHFYLYLRQIFSDWKWESIFEYWLGQSKWTMLVATQAASLNSASKTQKTNCL